MTAADEIRAVIDARIAALRNKDAEAAVACLAVDVVAFELAPPLARGPEGKMPLPIGAKAEDCWRK